jgi:hypothetical protein
MHVVVLSIMRAAPVLYQRWNIPQTAFVANLDTLSPTLLYVFFLRKNVIIL